MILHYIDAHGPSFDGKVPFCLALHLLRLHLGRDDSVVNNVWSVDCIDRGHPRNALAVHTPRLKG